jgi:mRNA-degrading endonuclease YafQ of YafQ-DinJ toxin-antitoxin module
VAQELIILQRFKRDYRNARKHAEFDAETLEYVFDALFSGERVTGLALR